MTSNTEALQPIKSSGWSAGFSNLFNREMTAWLRTRFGLIQLLLWVLIINGLTAIIIATGGEDIEPGQTVVSASIEPFVGISAWFTSIGIAVVAMGAVIGEKQSGTAAWSLSAPISRFAFLGSKLLALTIGGLVTMVLIPGAIVFAEFTFMPAAAESGNVSILPWMGTIAAMGLSVLFYLALTIFLGTIFSSRGAVVGIPIGVFFLGMFLGPILPQIVGNLTPWTLIPLAMEIGDETKTVSSFVPFGTSMIWIAALVWGSIWRFQKQEF